MVLRWDAISVVVDSLIHKYIGSNTGAGLFGTPQASLSTPQAGLGRGGGGLTGGLGLNTSGGGGGLFNRQSGGLFGNTGAAGVGTAGGGGLFGQTPVASQSGGLFGGGGVAGGIFQSKYSLVC